MRAHITKNEFKFVAISVMVLEVAAFLVFIFGTLGAILGTYSGISTTDFILLGFGGIFVALMLMAVAEILQVMMRIEYNTRKENTLLKQQMQVQQAEVRATKSVASFLKKVSPLKKSSVQAKVKKPAVKKMKPNRK
ncbi:MAG: hypothetical protein AB7J40_00260 [Candidatus Altimarinota bacterium]